MTLVVARVRGLAVVQDGGRPGHAHAGVPAGGALVPELLVAANRAVGNPPFAAAVELVGDARFTVTGGARAVSLDGERRLLSDDEPLDVTAGARRVRYLAVAGGLDVPVVLDGRGTLAVAHLGGHEGRALRAGDAIAVGAISLDSTLLDARLVEEWLDPEAPVRLVAGPDRPELLADLVDHAWTIAPQSDRTGFRLDGALLQRSNGDSAAPTPMVPGAVELPASGAPIVLGPDGPTTGGYSVVAVVARVDRGRLFARRPAARVRFVLVELAEAAAAWHARRAALGVPVSA